MMDSLVIYPGWKFVSHADFPMLHQVNSKGIISVYVFPTLALTVLTVIMIWKRPSQIPRHWVILAFSCELIIWISSVFIQIPIQFHLNTVKDEAALQRLMMTDWIRIIAWLIYIVVVSNMVIRILALVSKTRSAPQNV